MASGGLGSLEDLNWDPGDGRSDDGYHAPESREQQQADADRAWSEIERRAGRTLSKAQRRAWHDEITGRGYGYDRILKEGIELFCKGG